VHVAVLGAGALGRIFGVRLATRGKVDVDFVVRESRLSEAAGTAGPIAIERVQGGERLSLATPSFVAEVPAHADVVLGCVGAHQLGGDFISLLQRGPHVPVVIVTPMLPRTHARVEAALPGRVVPAFTNVTGYVNESGVTRHWISRSMKMLFDEAHGARTAREPQRPVMDDLLAGLAAAGIEGRIELGVQEASASGVIAILPLLIAIDAGGSIDALMGQGPLLATMFRAIKEARTLAERCGQVPGWARTLDRFLGPLTLKVGLALGRRRSPEIVSFVEASFGRRARAQNAFLAEELLALADEKGVPCPSVRALAGRLT
jgi:ketopantoate reductase